MAADCEAQICVRAYRLVLAKEFVCILNEADDDHYRGASHANEEHDLQNMHCKQTESHDGDCIAELSRISRRHTIP
jgi:hypothetical protein